MVVVQRRSRQTPRSLAGAIAVGLIGGAWGDRAIAQIVPDDSLPVPSQVRSTPANAADETRLTIDGGTRAGSNLFHSFRDFSVPTGTTAHFQLDPAITRTFARVTGDRPSHLDGRLSASGNSSLFLMNPNGILFGENARLDLNGSFFATTADRVLFQDGSAFPSHRDPDAAPLLSITAPLGLQWSGDRPPAPLEVRGRGANVSNPPNLPFASAANNAGLTVAADRVLGLFGGRVVLDGAFLSAPGGSIQIVSVRQGDLTAATDTPARAPDYDDILVGDRSAIFTAAAPQNASSVAPLSFGIALRGRQIRIEGGSVLAIQTVRGDGGLLDLNASDRIVLDGRGSQDTSHTSLINETLSPSRGGDILLRTPVLDIRNGASLDARTFSSGRGGDIDLHVGDRLLLSGAVPGRPNLFSSLNTATYASGNGGNLDLQTRNLDLRNGAILAATTFGSGAGGNLNLTVADTVTLSGVNPETDLPTAISIATFGSGHSGNLTLDTDVLQIFNGAQLSASTLASGDAGRIDVRARSRILLDGRFRNLISSSIDSSANLLPPDLQALLGVPSVPEGASGNVFLSAPQFDVRDGAIVSVNNAGIGNAGDVRIQADRLHLSGGGLSASTESGGGGSLTLILDRALRLENGSRISVTAGGSGNGGNIRIQAPAIAALDNSDITADAIVGSGGNIRIQTQGLFGTQFRDRPSDRSDITASSAFGLSGIVDISTSPLLPQVELSELSTDFVDVSQQIAPACIAPNNRFVITGRGGLPDIPTSPQHVRTFWEDRRLGEVNSGNAQPSTDASADEPDGNLASSARESAAPIREARTWRRNDRGQIELLGVARSSFLPNCPQPAARDAS